jgi:hypothetical protein
VADAPGGGDDEGVRHGVERDVLVEEGLGELAVGTTEASDDARGGDIEAEELADVALSEESWRVAVKGHV